MCQASGDPALACCTGSCSHAATTSIYSQWNAAGEKRFNEPQMSLAVLVLMFGGRTGNGQGDLRVDPQIALDVFGDDEPAPHELVVAREGADVLVISFDGGSRELERFLLARLQQAGGGADVRRPRGGGAALVV